MELIELRFIIYWLILLNSFVYLELNMNIKKFAYISLIVCYIITSLNIDYALGMCSSNRGIGCMVSYIGYY